MAWETRKGTDQRYYTRTITRDGHRVRVYVGTGLLAELEAAKDAQKLERQAEERARRQQRAQAWQARERLWSDYEQELALYTSAHLLTLGCHYDSRRRWRRYMKAKLPAASASVLPALPDDGRWSDELRTIYLTAAKSGNDEARPYVVEIIKSRPGWEERLRKMTRLARRRMIEDTHADGFSAECLALEAERLQAELEGEHPTALDRALCERVATTWLEVELLDASKLTQGGQSVVLALQEQYERIRTHAAQRYLAACNMLARVRRLEALTPLRAPIAFPVAPAAPRVAKLG